MKNKLKTVLALNSKRDNATMHRFISMLYYIEYRLSNGDDIDSIQYDNFTKDAMSENQEFDFFELGFNDFTIVNANYQVETATYELSVNDVFDDNVFSSIKQMLLEKFGKDYIAKTAFYHNEHYSDVLIMYNLNNLHELNYLRSAANELVYINFEQLNADMSDDEIQLCTHPAEYQLYGINDTQLFSYAIDLIKTLHT